MNEFDIKAKEWDNNPVHIERSEAVAREIRKSIKLTNRMKAFEYGCGTGLLSFNLYRELGSIIMADSSAGMLEMLNRKIKDQNVRNMKPLLIDLENEDIPGTDFDLIFTQMTLHHVTDIDGIFKKFNAMLNPNGVLCIADLYKEDGSFHGQDFTGHNGFDPEGLKIKMETAGFKSVEYRECHKMIKNIKEKEIVFPLFIIIGKKSI